jgi:hypothetical protein
MFADDVTPAVYLFSMQPEFVPTLTITTADGETVPVAAVEEGVQLVSSLGTGESAVGASLPETPGNIQLTVSSGGVEGLYGLVLLIKTGEPVPGDGIAQVTDNEDGSITLACNEQMVSENAVRFTLPDDDETYTVTAVGLAEFDPILAVVDDRNTGICFDNTLEAIAAYEGNLPTVAAQASLLNAQGLVDEDARTVVIGSHGSITGEMMVLIEGGAVEADDGGDTFGVQITPGMVSIFDSLAIYVISPANDIDPVLAYINQEGEVVADDEGNPYRCDNAGVVDACYGQAISMEAYGITVADGSEMTAFGSDALLVLPINDTLIGAIFPFRVTANEDTSGNYFVVFHIVTE